MTTRHAHLSFLGKSMTTAAHRTETLGGSAAFSLASRPRSAEPPLRCASPPCWCSSHAAGRSLGRSCRQHGMPRRCRASSRSVDSDADSGGPCVPGASLTSSVPGARSRRNWNARKPSIDTARRLPARLTKVELEDKTEPARRWSAACPRQGSQLPSSLNILTNPSSGHS